MGKEVMRVFFGLKKVHVNCWNEGVIKKKRWKDVGLSERGASFYVPYMGVSLNGGTPKTP